MLTIEDVRARVPVSRRTIYTLIERAAFPKPVKVPGRGNRVFFDPAAVDTWATRHGYGVQG